MAFHVIGQLSVADQIRGPTKSSSILIGTGGYRTWMVKIFALYDSVIAWVLDEFIARNGLSVTHVFEHWLPVFLVYL